MKRLQREICQCSLGPEAGAGAFLALSRSRARNKKERESSKKKEREKSENAERERKSANSRFFLPPTLEAPSSSAQRCSAGGKARVLSKMYSKVES